MIRKLIRKFAKSKLEKSLLTLNKKDISFIQVGACDGKSFDQIFKLVNKYKMKGVLLEPVPMHFKNLKKNYAGIKGLKFVNKAIGSKNGKAKMYTISEEGFEHLPNWMIGITSFYKDKNALSEEFWKKNTSTRLKRKGINYGLVKKYIKEIEVETIHMQDLFNEHNITNLDLLQIDAEGFDYEVIKQVDFNRVCPSIIHFEFNSLNDDEKSLCKKLLIDNNYSINFYNQMDMIAIKNTSNV